MVAVPVGDAVLMVADVAATLTVVGDCMVRLVAMLCCLPILELVSNFVAF